MIAYVTIGTNDIDKAKEFYGKLLGELGANPLMENERMVGYGKSFTEPMVVVCKPFDESAATVGNGMMVSLNAGSKDKVDALYKAAIDAGGQDEGEPGLRGGQWYMAYARDLDGNKLAFFAAG